MTNSSPTFAPAGGAGTVTIAVARECTWSATTQAGWIAFTGSHEGQGDGTVGYRVAENTDPAARQAAIDVADLHVNVSQEPAPCDFEVSNEPVVVPASGGAFAIGVRTHPACGWTASSEVTWATVAPASGKGDGSVTVTVDQNDGALRPVAVQVAGLRVVATQVAPGTPTPTPKPSPDPTPTPDPIPVEFTDRIDALGGTCPALTLTFGRYTVFTTAATKFKKVSCDKLEKDMRVKISGALMADGRVRADELEKK